MVVMLDLADLQSKDLAHLKHPQLQEAVREARNSEDSSPLTKSAPSTATASSAGDFVDDAIVHDDSGEQKQLPKPRSNITGFATALGCYPIVTSLARLLDLNSLHDLSRTCRQFRATLLLYRNQLISQTLRCSNEQDLNSSPDGGHMGEALAMRIRESHARWRLEGLNGAGRLTSGRVGLCARDMVAECRKCGEVVCRNCTAKPPPIPALAGRHRRLCHSCIHAPLSLHLSSQPPPTPRASPRASPARLARIPTPTKFNSDDDEEDNEDNDHEDHHSEPGNSPSSTSSSDSSSSSCSNARYTKPAFASGAFLRDPCSCVDFVWLCTSCGHKICNVDTTYARGWTWRTKYSHLGGGLGTGLAEGNKGVECGRKGGCTAARLVEQEVEVDAEVLRGLEAEAEKVAAQGTGRSWTGSSFVAQEIEGVGGMVKMKVRRLVRVGAEVDEFEVDEGVRCLQRESRREVRSWCAWCERVIPSKHDGWDED